MYEGCIDFALNYCLEKQLYESVGCENCEEFVSYQGDLSSLIKQVVFKPYLLENRKTNSNAL